MKESGGGRNRALPRAVMQLSCACQANNVHHVHLLQGNLIDAIQVYNDAYRHGSLQTIPYHELSSR